MIILKIKNFVLVSPLPNENYEEKYVPKLKAACKLFSKQFLAIL